MGINNGLRRTVIRTVMGRGLSFELAQKEAKK